MSTYASAAGGLAQMPSVRLQSVAISDRVAEAVPDAQAGVPLARAQVQAVYAHQPPAAWKYDVAIAGKHGAVALGAACGRGRFVAGCLQRRDVFLNASRNVRLVLRNGPTALLRRR